MEEIINIKQKPHCQLPNHMQNSLPKKLTPRDQLVYLSIKYCDGQDGCHPSLATISRISKASIPTVRKCINNLVANKYLSIEKMDKGIKYSFLNHDDEGFERIAKEFIVNESLNLTFNEKAYIVSMQQYLYKNGCIGQTTYTDQQIANLLNMTRSSVSDINRSLIAKNFMYITKIPVKQDECNYKKHYKVFNLDALGLIIDVLNVHEGRIERNEDDIQNLKENNQKLYNYIKKLEHAVITLYKRQNTLEEFNKNIIDEDNEKCKIMLDKQ